MEQLREYLPATGINFVEAADEWARWLQQQQYSPKTIQTYNDMLKQIKHLIGHVEVADIDAFYVQGIMGERKDWKPATKNLVLSMVKNILKHQTKLGRMKETPKMDYYQVDNGRDRILSADEVRQLLKFARDPLRLMLKIAMATGLRKHNLFNLRWDQVIDGYIVVRVKGGKERKIPLPSLVQDDLQLYGLNQMKEKYDSNFVFPSNRVETDKALCDRADMGLPALTERLGFGHITWHTIRHTFASMAMKATKDVVLVRDLMGHSNVTVTNRYLHVLDEDLREAADTTYQAWQ